MRLSWFNNYIISFCCTNSKFIDWNRLDRLTICTDYRHF